MQTETLIRARVWSRRGIRKPGPTGTRGHSLIQYDVCRAESVSYPLHDGRAKRGPLADTGTPSCPGW
jgi:hypothetical protein